MSDTPRTPSQWIKLEQERDYARYSAARWKAERNEALARAEAAETQFDDATAVFCDTVKMLKAERDEARAELARLTTPQPACDHDNETLVIAFLSDRTQQRLARHLEPWEYWIPLRIPTSKEPTP